MKGVDYGSAFIKWFDGKNFGKVPSTESFDLKGAVVGVSSRTSFLKEAFYPTCSFKKLKPLIVNDVSSEMMVPEEEISVAFCVKERLENGCKVLVFVVKREDVAFSVVPKIVTLDLLGGIGALGLLYEGEEFSFVDSGASKTAIVNFRNGEVDTIEIVRVGFDYLKRSRDYFFSRILPLIKSKNVILAGGGAFDRDFVSLFPSDWDLEIPNVSPFGRETPLFLNAYGLYHFRRSSCQAYFYRSSVFSSEFVKKHKGELLLSLSAFLGGIFLLSLSQGIQGFVCREHLLKEKEAFKREISNVLGEPAVAPDIQISQKISSLKREKQFLFLDKPSVLLPLRNLSQSVVPGVTVYLVEGSIDSDVFTVKGEAVSDKAFSKFLNALKKRFSKVSNVSTAIFSKILKFSLTVSGVKSEG